MSRTAEIRKPIIVAVVGGGDESNSTRLAAAETVGQIIAKRGGILVTGGKGGVMEAASRGANRAGGVVVGILPGRDPGEPNPFVAIPIRTGLGEARNAVIAATCDAMIAVGGEFGTLSEMALAMKMNRPVAVFDSPWATVPNVTKLTSPHDAVNWLDGVVKQS